MSYNENANHSFVDIFKSITIFIWTVQTDAKSSRYTRNYVHYVLSVLCVWENFHLNCLFKHMGLNVYENSWV